MKYKSTNNRKNNAARNRQKRSAGFASRMPSMGINHQAAAPKNAKNGRRFPIDLPVLKRYLLRNIWNKKMKRNKPKPENSPKSVQETKRIRESGETNIKDTLNPELREGARSRWSNNPRITGAAAAILLFATLAIAIIPTSLNVRAEEQAEAAALDPTMQLAKEYIYAGSRMLAIEDYGLNAGTPTPSPTPSLTPTPQLQPRHRTHQHLLPRRIRRHQHRLPQRQPQLQPLLRQQHQRSRLIRHRLRAGGNARSVR